MRQDVEFLIVTALDDELRWAQHHLGPLQLAGREYFGAVPRSGGGEYRIALVSVAGMGPDDAQRETTAALARVRTQYVLLIGIAAGFPEKGLGFGDIMIPE